MTTRGPGKMFEGVYAVSLKEQDKAVPRFVDWLFLENPFINKQYIYRGKTWLLTAFSGIPPLGQALLHELDDHQINDDDTWTSKLS